ncbi:hypothetical protein BH09PSE2_BH09PSE2_18430 [soil metagenome]
MIRTPLVVLALVLLAGSSALAAPVEKPATCKVQLKTTHDALALSDVKLQEEVERSDAQTYLTRLELSVTKKKLADALAKCGAACAPASPGAAR